MATLTVTGTTNYRGAPAETNITDIVFDTTAFSVATFDAQQFGPGLIADNVIITGDGFTNRIQVIATTSVLFSAAGWQFVNWTSFASDVVIIWGTSGNDMIVGSSQYDLIRCQGGLDSINAGAGNDSISVGPGIAAGTTIDGGTNQAGGGDGIMIESFGTTDFRSVTITGVEWLGFHSLFGNQTAIIGADQIGAAGINHVNGADGAMILDVRGSSVDLSGVTFQYWDADETLIIRGTSSVTNSLIGSVQNDLILGAAGTDFITGGSGNDVLNGLANADTMTGGFGNDTFHVDSTADQISETAGQGSDTIITSASYILEAGVSVELLRTLGSASTVIVNLAGNELVQTMQGNAAANILNGAGGADAMQGFAGNDTYYVNLTGDIVTETVGNGSDRVIVTASISYTLTASSHIELLRTTGSSSTYNVNLHGNNLINTVQGNNGTNVLSSGLGNDILTGFGGSDTFRFNTALGPTNVDTITDYNATADTIQLENAIFTALTTTGTLAAVRFNTGSAATQSDDRIIYNTITGALLYDADGLGGAAGIQFATLSTKPTITAADFVVI